VRALAGLPPRSWATAWKRSRCTGSRWPLTKNLVLPRVRLARIMALPGCRTRRSSLSNAGLARTPDAAGLLAGAVHRATAKG